MPGPQGLWVGSHTPGEDRRGPWHKVCPWPRAGPSQDAIHGLDQAEQTARQPGRWKDGDFFLTQFTGNSGVLVLYRGWCSPWVHPGWEAMPKPEGPPCGTSLFSYEQTPCLLDRDFHERGML